MKIIQAHRTKSKPVKAYKEIKEAAGEMLDMIHGTFQGKWAEAFALSHCQVDKAPYAFFVVNTGMEAAFGCKVVINLKILAQEDSVPFKEACMSFPFRNTIRTKRFNRVIVEFERPGLPVPFTSGLIKERRELTALAAFVAQHEADHAAGIDIFHRFSRN